MITYIPSPNFTLGRRGNAADTFVIHWIDGYQKIADRRFADPSSQVSAHFSVEDGNVHQYVRLQDTAWHAGSFGMNLRSVGIEHSAQPGRDASDATYEESAQLVVQVAKSLGKPVTAFRFVRHGDIVPTQCCGTVDVQRIYRRALEIAAGVGQATYGLASSVLVLAAFDPFLTNLSPSQAFNEEVKRMQRYLTAKGFFQDQGSQDGYYGPKTQAAVHDFQEKHGIVPSPAYYGWWYDKTRAAANSDLIYQPIVTNSL